MNTDAHAENHGEEFSRTVNVRSFSRERTEHFEADARERAALAQRFDLDVLEKLDADVTFQPHADAGGWHLNVHMTADVVQPCVVTLEPVTTHIDVTFQREFVFHGGEPNTADKMPMEVDLSVEEEDLPEAIAESGDIDVGAVIAEQLGLEVPAFPRKEDAELVVSEKSGVSVRREGEPDPDSPFAVLRELKKDQEKSSR